MKLINKIGVIAESFQVGILEGLKKSKEFGADGVQIYAHWELEPEHASPAFIKDVRDHIASLNLEVSALCFSAGGLAFQDQSVNRQNIERFRRVADLALTLGTNIVTTHIGIIPEDPRSEIYKIMLHACEQIGLYASGVNCRVAIETGPETAQVLKTFLDQLSTEGVAVNFDPANMVMVTGEDPVAGVKLLKDYIIHTHVKDGIRYAPVDPREVYGFLGFQSDETVQQLIAENKKFEELPLGKGAVDFNAYFRALQEIGYTGYLTVEREVGVDPELDIRHAVEYIKRYK